MNFNKKYSGKDILIIGGGTSTLDVKWEGILKPDTFIWTCNDFYKNKRISKQRIDLYQLGFYTDLNDKILQKRLSIDKPFTYFEPDYFRSKNLSKDFIEFETNIGFKVRKMRIENEEVEYSLGQKAGAALRLILLALTTKARNIYFVGLDGFDESFSNTHAFTGHIGLKNSDNRRDWKTGYYNVFMEAYLLLSKYDKYNRLQNLGEGLKYNIGTPVSKRDFPLRKEIYEKIR